MLWRPTRPEQLAPGAGGWQTAGPTGRGFIWAKTADGQHVQPVAIQVESEITHREGELAAIEEFFLASQGAFGSFSFTDPWDGQVYDNCSVGADDLALVTEGEMRGSTALTIVRNV